MKKILAAILVSLIFQNPFHRRCRLLTRSMVYCFKTFKWQKFFPDGKTFVDCVPKKDPKEIVKEYLPLKTIPPCDSASNYCRN
jgi:alpha,alpha-trehalase